MKSFTFKIIWSSIWLLTGYIVAKLAGVTDPVQLAIFSMGAMILMDMLRKQVKRTVERIDEDI